MVYSLVKIKEREKSKCYAETFLLLSEQYKIHLRK